MVWAPAFPAHAPGTRLVAKETEHLWWSGTWGGHWEMATRAGHGVSVGDLNSGALGDGHSEPPSCYPKAIPSLTLAMSWEGVKAEVALCCGDSVGASVTHGVPAPWPAWGLDPQCHMGPHPVLQHCPLPLMSPCRSCSHAVLQLFPPWWGAGYTQMKPYCP